MKRPKSRWAIDHDALGRRLYVYGWPRAWRIQICRSASRRHVWCAWISNYGRENFRTLHAAKRWALSIDRAMRRVRIMANPSTRPEGK